MAVTRPLSKELLKKMSLKVLAKADRGKENYHDTIQFGIQKLFNIEKLTKEEIADGFLGIYELDRDGFIIQAPGFHPDVKMLTARGLKVVADDLANMKLPSINIDDLISHDDLRSIVRDDFSSGDYETAIFRAFRFLEECVRTKSGQPASAIGVNLMTTVFRVNGGLLRHSEALVDSEAEAFHQLMRGAIGWFKNPSSHRTVGYDDEHQAAHVLSFANLLLDMLDACK